MSPQQFFQSYPIAREAVEKTFADQTLLSVEPIKKGLTNCSFILSAEKNGAVGRYVVRVPGKNSASLVDREGEAAVYALLDGKGITEKILYIDPASGIKISEYCEHSRSMDPYAADEVAVCMELLRRLHTVTYDVSHFYDFFDYIDSYEALREGRPSMFDNYADVKRGIFALKPFLDTHKKPYCLIHNDISPDNCLIIEENGKKSGLLIDWEYAAMQDPDADAAYFCVSADYSEEQIENVVRTYLGSEADNKTSLAAVYAYIAVNALVQSNWMEIKHESEDDIAENRRYFALAETYRQKAAALIENIR